MDVWIRGRKKQPHWGYKQKENNIKISIDFKESFEGEGNDVSVVKEE